VGQSLSEPMTIDTTGVTDGSFGEAGVGEVLFGSDTD
jgi:hypothetical protein